jgi:amino-acid N-acetyltransferase
MENVPISRHPTLQGVRNLLGSAGLPTEDLSEPQLEHFFFVGNAVTPTALVGAEIFGEHALLRSLAVSANQREQGLGSLLVAHLEQHARECGVGQIFLLTTTARDFFARRGYESVARESAPASIRRTREFADICPASSAFMAKVLAE